MTQCWLQIWQFKLNNWNISKYNIKNNFIGNSFFMIGASKDRHKALLQCNTAVRIIWWSYFKFKRSYYFLNQADVSRFSLNVRFRVEYLALCGKSHGCRVGLMKEFLWMTQPLTPLPKWVPIDHIPSALWRTACLTEFKQGAVYWLTRHLEKETFCGGVAVVIVDWMELTERELNAAGSLFVASPVTNSAPCQQLRWR